MGVRILLVDDHQLTRQGLRSLLGEDPDFQVVGEAGTGREAVAMAKDLQPNVVMMDVAMPDMNGMQATHQLRRAVPEAKIIGLSMHKNRQLVTAMLQAGANGYVLKDASIEEVGRAIRTVIGGGAYLAGEVTGDVVDEYLKQRRASEPKPMVELTAREREVLQLVAEGLTTKEIAHELTVSTKTIESHRSNLMTKLNAHTIAQLTKHAVRMGLTTLEH